MWSGVETVTASNSFARSSSRRQSLNRCADGYSFAAQPRCCEPSSIAHRHATATYGLSATPLRSDFPLPPQPTAASRSLSFAPRTRDQLLAESSVAVPIAPVFRNCRREERRDFMGHLCEKRLAP